MATTKTTPAEETKMPKKFVIPWPKDFSAADKLATMNAAKQEIENAVIADLDAQEATLQEQVEAIRRRRNEILPPRAPQQNEHPAGRTRGPKAPKAEGIKVSASALTDRIKAVEDGVLNIRQEKLDIPTVKQLAKDHPDKFKINANGPWPTVSLA